jgi:hypothetical protein
LLRERLLRKKEEQRKGRIGLKMLKKNNLSEPQKERRQLSPNKRLLIQVKLLSLILIVLLVLIPLPNHLP